MENRRQFHLQPTKDTEVSQRPNFHKQFLWSGEKRARLSSSVNLFRQYIGHCEARRNIVASTKRATGRLQISRYRRERTVIGFFRFRRHKTRLSDCSHEL